MTMEQAQAEVVTTTAGTSTIATASTAAMTAVASDGRLLTAHQGDADDREENRDSKHKRTIHPTSSN
jgi:hypothetical protein